MDPGHGERLFERERGQEPGQTLGQHRLARAGRAHHEEVVPTGGSDFEGVAADGLSFNVGQIGGVREWREGPWGRHGGPLGPVAQNLGQVGQRGNPMGLVAPHQGRLADIAQRHHHPKRRGGVGQGDHARDVPQRAVQAEFAAEAQPVRTAGWELVGGDQYADGDGQVEGTTEATLRTLGSDACRRRHAFCFNPKGESNTVRIGCLRAAADVGLGVTDLGFAQSNLLDRCLPLTDAARGEGVHPGAGLREFRRDLPRFAEGALE